MSRRRRIRSRRARGHGGIAPVAAIEIKLSQGAKPGLGGVLPGAKGTAEITAARGVPEGQTVVSPNHHAEFHDVDSMIDFIEVVAGHTGLPVGIKSAVGDQAFWDTLAARMRVRGEGPDFITIDGGEGGTGAAPLVFSDHVSLPLRHGLARVYRTLGENDLQRDVTVIASGRAGFPAEALAAIALGADLVNVGREAMLAIGCGQAQRCHTGRCPTGVATQSKWLARGLDPESKGARMANYAMGFRYDLDRLARACGAAHPSLVDPARSSCSTTRIERSPCSSSSACPIRSTASMKPTSLTFNGDPVSPVSDEPSPCLVAMVKNAADHHGEHTLGENCNSHDRSLEHHIEFRTALVDGADRKTAVLFDVYRRFDWDLFVGVYKESHCVGHQMWHVTDPTFPYHDPEISAVVGRPSDDVYRSLDATTSCRLPPPRLPSRRSTRPSAKRRDDIGEP